MQNLNRMHTSAVEYSRTNRFDITRNITSMPAGKMVPLAAIPLLREDALTTGRYRMGFEMSETVELLMNNVNVRVMAYVVPTLAFERFGGSMDILNRSYAGQPAIEGGSVVPFVENHEFTEDGLGVVRPVYEYLGMHEADDALVNTAYLEAYNEIWNFRAKNRSKDISLRGRLDDDLAEAFWLHENFAHIVPDFDQAKIDGEVALNVVDGALPVKGIGRRENLGAGDDGNTYAEGLEARESWGTTATRTYGASVSGSDILLETNGTPDGVIPAVYAEMVENGITVSLSNIELARKTQAFAKIRERYQGIDDEWLIDMLMGGMTIPDQALKQPMLLAERRAVFGMGKRYSASADDLTASVVNGIATVDLAVRVPRLVTGGVVMIVAEITPEQLFERQRDPYFSMKTDDEFPYAISDVLDPEKVDVVTNGAVDIDHATPNDTFGYEPMNAKWNRNLPRIGGKFRRPKVDAGFDEDRQRFWAVETQNPTLSADFYLCTSMHYKPFVVTDTDVDPFECITVGRAVINGNTQFGHVLIEASDDYEKVLEKADQTRIEKDVEE